MTHCKNKDTGSTDSGMYLLAWILPEAAISPCRLQCWVASSQTTNGAGTQPHPSADKRIKDSLNMALCTRGTKSSSTHQWTRISLSHQEACTNVSVSRNHQRAVRRTTVLRPVEQKKQSQKVKVKSLSHVQLFATRWTVAYQASPSMGFSRQEYWSGLPFPSPGESSQPRDRTRVSCIGGRRFNPWATGKPQKVSQNEIEKEYVPDKGTGWHPEEQLSEIKIANLLEEEFGIIVKMIKDLRKRMEARLEKDTIDVCWRLRRTKEQTDEQSEMKNTPEGINRISEAEEQISDLKDNSENHCHGT